MLLLKKQKTVGKGIIGGKNSQIFSKAGFEKNILTLKMDRWLLLDLLRKMAFGLEANTFLKFFSHVSGIVTYWMLRNAVFI